MTPPPIVTPNIQRATGEELTLPANLRWLTNCDAAAYQAVCKNDAIDEMVGLIKANKLLAYFMFDGDNTNAPIGGSLQVPSVITEWTGCDFQYYPALYYEDTVVRTDLSVAFRDHQKSTSIPHGMGLGTYLAKHRAHSSVFGSSEDMPYGLPAYGRIGEVGTRNVAMQEIISKFNGQVGYSDTSAVLQFTNDINHFQHTPEAFTMLEAFSINRNDAHAALPNIFVVTWLGVGGKERISATFTESVSSFTGQPVVRVQIKSSPTLQNSANVEAAVIQLLLRGCQEIVRRNWIGHNQATALQEAWSSLRIHLLDEPIVFQILRESGAELRMLGNIQMLPTQVCFVNTAADFVDLRTANFRLHPVNQSLVDFEALPVSAAA